MSRSIVFTSLATALLVASAALAQVPAGAPAGTTGACKDGSFTSAAAKKGACRGHKGVKDWYASADSAATPAASSAAASSDSTPKSSRKKRGHKGDADSASPSTAAAPAAAAAAGSPPVAASTSAPARTTAATTKTAARSKFVPPANAAPGGGPGLVWANKESKVYHCQDDRWYGKTKQGEYMSESDAKAQGFHASHGKGCQG